MKLLFFTAALLLAEMLGTGTDSVSESCRVEAYVEHQLYLEVFPSGNKPDFEVFNLAMLGYRSLQDSTRIFKRQTLTIIDFSRPSTEKRLWVIDLERKILLLNTLVAHGRNSGELVPEHFSNRQNSFQSSLGFYVTGSTYLGKHGLSLLLRGLESGINDQAKARAIVVHGADYVSEKIIQSAGRIGRSQGCPAVPVSVHRELIAMIKDQTCIFIYSPDKEYFQHTKLIRPDELLAITNAGDMKGY